MKKKIILKRIKSIEPYLKSIGIPYKWCQILCGLYYENKSDRHALISSSLTGNINEASTSHQNDSKSSDLDESMTLCDEGSSETDNRKGASKEIDQDEDESLDSGYLNETKIFEQIINRLKSRFKARITLQETINSLSWLYFYIKIKNSKLKNFFN